MKKGIPGACLSVLTITHNPLACGTGVLRLLAAIRCFAIQVFRSAGWPGRGRRTARRWKDGERVNKMFGEVAFAVCAPKKDFFFLKLVPYRQTKM